MTTRDQFVYVAGLLDSAEQNIETVKEILLKNGITGLRRSGNVAVADGSETEDGAVRLTKSGKPDRRFKAVKGGISGRGRVKNPATDGRLKRNQ